MLYRSFIKIIFIATMLFFFGTSSYARTTNNALTHKVQDLAYGVSLFNFFQQKHFSAITDLLVAEHYQRIKLDNNNPSVLLGGLYLAYDLHDQSSEVFKRLLKKDPSIVSIPAQDQAHFLLGKNYFHNGFYAEAEKEFGRIRNTLSFDEDEEKLFLMNKLFLYKGDFTMAQKTLSSFAPNSNWIDYAKFNTGTHLIQRKEESNIKVGFSLLNELALNKSKAVEQRIIRNKANLALGFVSLREGDSARSIGYFNKIDLKSDEANKALLGIGWAHFREKDYEEAAMSWMHLASTDSETDLSVQEAFVSISTAFEKLKLNDQALYQYGLAIDHYTYQLDETQKLVDLIKSPKFIKQINKGSLGQEITSEVELIKNLDPMLIKYMLPFLASEEFQRQAKTYLEVAHLKHMIKQWKYNVPALRMILDQKKATYEKKLSRVMDGRSLERIKLLRIKRNALSKKIKQIEMSNNPLSLPSVKEIEHINRLTRIENALKRLSEAGEDISQFEEKHRLLRGLLVWNVDTDFLTRIWDVTRQLEKLDDEIIKMDRSMRSLTSTWKNAPMHFAEFGGRISDKAVRIKNVSENIDQAIAMQEKKLRTMMLDNLKIHRDKINSYYDRALFSKARLFDALRVRK